MYRVFYTVVCMYVVYSIHSWVVYLYSREMMHWRGSFVNVGHAVRVKYAKAEDHKTGSGSQRSYLMLWGICTDGCCSQAKG